VAGAGQAARRLQAVEARTAGRGGRGQGGLADPVDLRGTSANMQGANGIF
jgi:hypothetical protein